MADNPFTAAADSAIATPPIDQSVPVDPESGLRKVYITGGQEPAPDLGQQGGAAGGDPLQTKLDEIDAQIAAQSATPDRTAIANGPNSGNGNELQSPGPDPDHDPLGKLDQLAEQAMREGGFVGYTPSITSLKGNEEGSSKVQSAITDIAAGFNDSLAKAISAPRDVVDRGMAMLGLDYMQHGKPSDQTVAALNRMGIPTYEVENLANKMGHGALPALATWAAIQVSAPYMAAQQGVSTAGYLAREIGEWALKHPVAGLWLGQTSSAGGETAKDVTGSDNPLVPFAGEIAGGMVGSGVSSIAKGGAKVVSKVALQPIGKAVNALSDSLPTDLGNMVKKYNPFYQQPASLPDALVKPGLDVGRVQNFAENQVEGLKMQMDDAVARAVNSVPQRGTSVVQSQIFHSNLQQAEQISNRLVSEAWQKTPLRQRIPVGDMRKEAIAMRQELVDTPSVRPDEYIDKLIHVSSPIRGPDGKMIKAAPTIQRLRDLQAELRVERINEQAKDAPRDGYIRNLVRLSNIIDDNIAAQMPNDTTIAQARAASTAHHDRFSRGPIADVLAKRYRGDFRISPSDSVDALSDREGGLAAVRDMARQLSTHKLTTADEKKILATMVKNAEDSIRAGFREAVDKGGPAAGVKYQQQREHGIKALATVSGELELAASKVKTSLDVKQTIEKSAFARFAQTDPEKAVARIFADKNPAEVARQLVRNFSGDPDALEGLRNAVLTELLYNRAKNDPVRMRELLNSSRVGDLMSEILSSDQMRRLNKIVSDSIRLTTGEDKSLKSKLATPFTIFGRVIGAQMGRFVSRHTGGGTIQVPGIFANATAKQFERIFASTKPSDMMTLAILDPHWEKMLYSRLPTTTKDMKAAAVNYRRLYATIDGARQAAVNKLSEDKSK